MHDMNGIEMYNVKNTKNRFRKFKNRVLTTHRKEGRTAGGSAYIDHYAV